MNHPEYRLKAIRHLEEMGWAPMGCAQAWRGAHKAASLTLVGAYTPETQAEDPECGSDIWVVGYWTLDLFLSWDEFTDEQIIDLWLHIVMEGL